MQTRLFTQSERHIFEQLCQAREQGVISVMYNFLKQRYTNIEKHPSFLLAKGDIPVALVAHADTVFKTPPKQFFYDKYVNVMWSPDGMGADDRAGIFAIFNIIKNTKLRPHIIITTGEESGCIGAGKMIATYPQFPAPLKFLIQLDRRGFLDSVYYDCANDEFERYINKFGFVTQWGSLSDISVLAPVWKVAAVNFSVGYIDEHSYIERLYVDVLFETINKVINILSDVQKDPSIPTFEYIDAFGPGFKYDYWDDHEDWASYSQSNHQVAELSAKTHCHFCDAHMKKEDVVPVFTERTNCIVNICVNCYARYSHKIKYCKKCNEAWLPIEGNEGQELCPRCKK